MSEINAVVLASRLVDLLKAKKSSQAVSQFITNQTIMEVPGMLSSNMYKGKADILKRWKAQPNDGMKVLTEEPFRLIRPGVVTRKLRAKFILVKRDMQHTIEFNPAGQIVSILLVECEAQLKA